MRFFDMTHKTPAGEVTMVSDGRRARSVQRLQIGLSGIGLMIMLVALASVVQDKVRSVDAVSVPGAAATTEPSADATGGDPLAEAGVVPDLQGTAPAGTRTGAGSANAAAAAAARARSGEGNAGGGAATIN